jgi:hypothetical protein
MPYADPDKRRAVKRQSERKRRAARGEGLGDLAEHLQQLADLPEPPSKADLLKALGMQAREGNVPAIRLLLEEYRRDGNSDDKPKRSKVDELAARRAARTG